MQSSKCLWGNTIEKSDARREEIAEFIVRCNLDMFNVADCDPTFSLVREDSWIDLTL